MHYLGIVVTGKLSFPGSAHQAKLDVARHEQRHYTAFALMPGHSIVIVTSARPTEPSSNYPYPQPRNFQLTLQHLNLQAPIFFGTVVLSPTEIVGSICSVSMES